MSHDNYRLYIMTYPTKEAAMDGFDAVEYAFNLLRNVDTYDAAIVARKDGKASIVRKREQAVHTKGREGLGIGLAAGACFALFPGVTLAADAPTNVAAGAVIGAMGGHIKSGISRADLRELVDIFEEGQFGLIVVTITDETRRVRAAVKRAIRFEQKQLKIDDETVRKQLDELKAEA